jgi:hypothetical protein
MARRQFSAEYKLRLLAQAARCSKRGELVALLRREKLTTAHLTKWRAIACRASRVAFEGSPSSAATFPDSVPTEAESDGTAWSPHVDLDVIRRLILLQNRLLGRVLAETKTVDHDGDLAELRALAAALEDPHQQCQD